MEKQSVPTASKRGKSQHPKPLSSTRFGEDKKDSKSLADMASLQPFEMISPRKRGRPVKVTKETSITSQHDSAQPHIGSSKLNSAVLEGVDSRASENGQHILKPLGQPGESRLKSTAKQSATSVSPSIASSYKKEESTARGKGTARKTTNGSRKNVEIANRSSSTSVAYVLKKNEATDAATLGPGDITPARKRGRPKKSKVLNVTSYADNFDNKAVHENTPSASVNNEALAQLKTGSECDLSEGTNSTDNGISQSCLTCTDDHSKDSVIMNKDLVGSLTKAQDDSAADLSAGKKGGEGRKRHVINDGDADHDTGITPTKKRGRPAKSPKIVRTKIAPEADNGEDDTDFKTPTLLKRGRKRTRTKSAEGITKNVLQPLQSPVDTNPTPTRKRGRPRKSCTTDSERAHENGADKSLAVTVEDTPTHARKHGRSRKSSLNDTEGSFLEDNTDSTTDTTPDPPKQTQGGPPKRTGKRGRSRKKCTSDSESKDAHEAVEAQTCIHCDKQCLSMATLRTHFMEKHMLVWRAGNPEGTCLGNSDLAYILKRLGYLVCLKCEKRIRYIQYYKNHVEWCGRENEKGDCPYCGKEYMLKWMPQHIRLHTPGKASKSGQSSKKQETDVVEEEPNDGQPRRRRAASMAIKHMKQVIEDDEEDGKRGKISKAETTKKKRTSNIAFTSPPLTIPTAEMKVNWTQLLKNNKLVTCPHKGCTKEMRNYTTLCNHYSNCSFNGFDEHEFKCSLCDHVTLSKCGMLVHITSKHKNDQDDADVSSGEEDDDDSVSSGVSEDSINTPSDDADDDNKKRKSVQRRPMPHSSGDNSLINSWKWTQDFNKQLTPFNMPWKGSRETWSLLNTSESEEYLPQQRHSAMFRLVRESSKKNILEGPLPLFGSITKGLNIFINVGGPVWAVDWCPLQEAGDTNQFAAICCHNNMDSVYNSSIVHTEKGVIQIWDCGKLKNSSHADAVTEPKLSLAIAHDYGCIWELKWCPVSAMPPGDGGSRLGVLAVACSDGLIRLLDIPWLADMKISDTERPIFKAEPTCILAVPEGSTVSQCISLDWMPCDGCQMIVGGFADGYVGVWDLMTQSSLLTRDQPAHPTLYPFQFFRAHSRPTTCVRWCPTSPYHFASCSLDARICIWDLRRIERPHIASYRKINKKNFHEMFRNISWSKHWSAIFAGLEDATVSERDGIKVNYPLCVRTDSDDADVVRGCIHNSSVWCTSVNDWLNSVITCDRFGRVNIFPVSDHVDYTSYLNRKNRRFYTLFDTTLEPLDNSNGSKHSTITSDELTANKDKEGTTGANSVSEESTEIPYRTFADIVQKCGLVFEDKIVDVDKKKPKVCKHEKPSDLRYPLTATHKVVCNPNPGSFAWVLCAGQSGVVRLLHLTDLYKVHHSLMS